MLNIKILINNVIKHTFSIEPNTRDGGAVESLLY